MVSASWAELILSSLAHNAIKDMGMDVAIKQLITARDELIKVRILADDLDIILFLL